MKTTLKMLAAAMILAASGAQASAIVGGVKFTAGSMQAQTSVFETSTINIGDELSGVGEIGLIDGMTPAEFCAYGACEVTFHFYDFILSNIIYNPFATTIPAALEFTGGKVDVYVDYGGLNFSNSDLSVAAATDGQLWLGLDGHTQMLVNPILGALFGSLISTNFGGSSLVSGTGLGALSVTTDVSRQGLANSNFDTDQYADGLGGFFDVSLDSSYTNTAKTDGTITWPISGSNTLNAKPIPEPSSLALLGLGILGLAYSVRRKQS